MVKKNCRLIAGLLMKKTIAGITLHIIVIADMFYAMTDLNLYPFYDIFLFLM